MRDVAKALLATAVAAGSLVLTAPAAPACADGCPEICDVWKQVFGHDLCLAGGGAAVEALRLG